MVVISLCHWSYLNTLNEYGISKENLDEVKKAVQTLERHIASKGKIGK